MSTLLAQLVVALATEELFLLHKRTALNTCHTVAGPRGLVAIWACLLLEMHSRTLVT